MRTATRRPLNQRGAAAVEFALVLPVLLLLVFGTIDWGFYFFTREVVTNAAREGARAGTLVAGGDPALATSAAQTVLAAGGLGGTATISPAIDGTSVTVTVSYPVGSVTGLFQGLIPAAISQTAVMRL